MLLCVVLCGSIRSGLVDVMCHCVVCYAFLFFQVEDALETLVSKPGKSSGEAEAIAAGTYLFTPVPLVAVRTMSLTRPRLVFIVWYLASSV